MVIHIMHHLQLKNRLLKVLAYGINHYSILDYNIGISTHAEVSAINKLPSTRKIQNIDIFVLKIDRNGKLGYSKPCENCIRYMKIKLPKRNYKINKIYYTTSNDDFEYMKL